MFGKNKRQREYGALTTEEKAAAADSLLMHLVDVVTEALLEGSEEARDHAVKHIGSDLEGNHPALLQAALGRAVILEGQARAEHFKREATERLLSALRDAETDAPAATDLLPDDEASEDSQPVSAAQEAEEKVWSEDRR